MWEKYVRSQKMISISNNIYGILGSLKLMECIITSLSLSTVPHQKLFKKKKKKKSGGSSLLTLARVVEQNFAKFRRLLQHLGMAK